jgi:hypothetical protein
LIVRSVEDFHVSEDADSSSAAPFELLGHETRVAIVEALVEARHEEPLDPALSFAELRERTGVRDSGRFNYHLDKLRGQFLQETEEGYRLSYAGQEVAGAILSGAFETGTSAAPAELDASCRACDATVEATYEDGILRVECQEGHLNHSDYFPPGLVDRLSLPAATEVSTLYGHHKLELLLREVCPDCTGPVTAKLVTEEEFPALEAVCDRCGLHFTGPPGLVVVTHPALRSVYLERDVDVRTAFLWSFPFLVEGDRYTVESESPLEVRIDASIEDRDLWFRIDEDCSVLDYGGDA